MTERARERLRSTLLPASPGRPPVPWRWLLAGVAIGVVIGWFAR